MIHSNLEKRFINLAVARNQVTLAVLAAKNRFCLLFDALAEDLGITTIELGERMGWGPIPEGGNKIMRGEAEPNDSDVIRLCNIYVETRP